MSSVVRGATRREYVAGTARARRGRGEGAGRGPTRKSTLRGLPHCLINLFPDNPCYSSEKRYLGRIL